MKYLAEKSANKLKQFRFKKLLFSVICVFYIGHAVAQLSGGEFEIIQSTIQTGGGTSTDSEFEITGTIAQPTANVQKSTVDEFTLSGGFWVHNTDRIFINGFENN